MERTQRPLALPVGVVDLASPVGTVVEKIEAKVRVGCCLGATSWVDTVFMLLSCTLQISERRPVSTIHVLNRTGRDEHRTTRSTSVTEYVPELRSVRDAL